jgi:hypothetical protein
VSTDDDLWGFVSALPNEIIHGMSQRFRPLDLDLPSCSDNLILHPCADLVMTSRPRAAGAERDLCLDICIGVLPVK